MLDAHRKHWPEYGIEAAGLGAFMVSASVFGVVLEHPGSPVREALPHPFVRRAILGIAMGLTAIAIIYSPWGRRSGAHIHPSVTLTFLRLGRVRFHDALFYVLFQCLGALAGIGGALAHPSVNFVATIPGMSGRTVAFLAEVGISFVLMRTVLASMGHGRLARYTGLFAGALVALYIAFEAPLSGMSMNPARTLGSAVAAGRFEDLWIYLVAPPLGMAFAAEAHLRRSRAPHKGCAKLQHAGSSRCIFCEERAAALAPSPVPAV